MQIEQIVEFTGAIGEFGMPSALVQNIKSPGNHEHSGNHVPNGTGVLRRPR